MCVHVWQSEDVSAYLDREVERVALPLRVQGVGHDSCGLDSVLKHMRHTAAEAPYDTSWSVGMAHDHWAQALDECHKSSFVDYSSAGSKPSVATQ